MRTADGIRPPIAGATDARPSHEPDSAPMPADIVAAQERERRHIAFDLHDGPTQSICSALLEAELLSRTCDPADRAERLARLRTALQASLDEMRAIVQRLRPAALDAGGLKSKLETYAEQVREETGMDVTVRFSGQADEISDTLQITIFRIVQEALTNAARHASASRATVEVQWRADGTECTVTDNGIGIAPDVDIVTMKGRHGLTGMRERAELLGGTFRVAPLPSGGTEVHVSIPAW